MCGIAGFIDQRRESGVDYLGATGAAMAAALRHRGPDDSGTWNDPQAGISLAHRRLAILDISPAGRQPMISSCGHMVLTYNGEIYNHAELRSDLLACGRKFRGHCDAEVLVEACAEWGVEVAIGRLVGMFAFAIWDRPSQSLTLARDRIGIKPLYWAQFGNLFMFGSELKALHAHGGWTPELDHDSVAAFTRYGHVPSPHSIYRGVHKLQPGHLLTLSHARPPEIHPYWDPGKVVVTAAANRLDVSEHEVIDGLDELLGEIVGQHMVADVPLGAFLSGGIDSSIVVSLMQARSNHPINTYSIGFSEPRYDESRHARAVAAHLGTAHTELYATPGEALDIIPGLPQWYDEPFADSSQIPTLLVSKLTRQHVTVALSGDGGDELFSGYRKYSRARVLASASRHLPAALRRATALGLAQLSTSCAALVRTLPACLRPEVSLNQLDAFGNAFAAATDDELFRRMVSTIADPTTIVMSAHERPDLLQDATLRASLPEFMERIGFFGMVLGLPDGILAKVDRASMAFGLEVRVPLLDHRIVEYAWRIPPALKYGGAGPGKKLLRRLLYRRVPRVLVDRPKRGFSVPVKRWLRGPLRPWAEELLDEQRLAGDGIFNSTRIRARWREHLAGTHNHQRLLWCILMFEQWRRHQTPMPTLGGRSAMGGPNYGHTVT